MQRRMHCFCMCRYKTAQARRKHNARCACRVSLPCFFQPKYVIFLAVDIPVTCILHYCFYILLSRICCATRCHEHLCQAMLNMCQTIFMLALLLHPRHTPGGPTPPGNCMPGCILCCPLAPGWLKAGAPDLIPVAK